MAEAEAVGIDTGGQPSGPLGFSWPVVLGGLAVVVVGILYMRSRQGASGGSGNPLATSVMLADIQGAQDVLRGEVQMQGAQTRDVVQGGFAEAMQSRADYYQRLSDQLGTSDARAASYYGDLANNLRFIENQLGTVYGQNQYTQQQLGTIYGQTLNLTNAQQSALAELLAAINGSTRHPPAGGSFTYQGWRDNFGATGSNRYDVNADNVVDVHDYGILARLFPDFFGGQDAPVMGAA